MAQVPVIPNQSVSPGGAPTPSVNPAIPSAAFGAPIATGLGAVASGADKASDMLEAHAQVMAGLANKADSDQQSIDFATQANAIKEDYKATQNLGNAQPSMPDYVAKIEAARVSAGQTLTNPMAQSMFDADSRRTAFAMIGEMSSHASQQQNLYNHQTSVGKIQSAADLWTQNPTNPDLEKQFLDTNTHETTYLSHLDGMNDPGTVNHQIAAQVSKTSLQVLEGIAAGPNPLDAQTFLTSHQGSFVGGDLATAEKYVHATVAPYQASQIANEYAQKVLSVGTPADAVWNSIKTQESGGQASPGTAVGPATSSGVALGSTQMLPATAEKMADKLGIPWQPALMHDNSPAGLAYQDKLGRAYFDEGLEKNGGDTAAAAAYYFGGPDMSMHGPKTAAYVAQVMARANPADSISVAQNPDNMRAELATQLDAMDSDPRFAGNDQLKNIAEAQLVAISNRHIDALTGVQKQAFDLVSQTASDPSAKPASLEAVFAANPAARGAFAEMTPGQQQFVTNIVKRNANPTIADMTPQAYSDFQQLDGLSKASPAQFADLDLSTDPRMKSLPTSYQMGMIKTQDSIKAGTASNGTLNAAIKVADPYLAKIPDAFPQDNSGRIDKTTPQYTTFVSRLNEDVQAYREIHKKDPGQDDVARITQQLLLNNTYQQKDTFTPVPGVPDVIAQSLQHQAYGMGRILTSSQIQTLYTRSQNGGR